MLWDKSIFILPVTCNQKNRPNDRASKSINFLPFDKFQLKSNNNLCTYGQINKLSIGIWAAKSTAN